MLVGWEIFNMFRVNFGATLVTSNHLNDLGQLWAILKATLDMFKTSPPDLEVSFMQKQVERRRFMVKEVEGKEVVVVGCWKRRVGFLERDQHYALPERHW